jgi:ATP-dependent protease HslVU (ClpYQ) peptidase subunit
MTIIIAAKENDKIIFGYDEMVSGGMKLNINDFKASKVFRSSDDLVIGGAGELAELNLMRLFSSTRVPENNNLLAIIRYMMAFISYIKDQGINQLTNHYIICWKGELYEVIGDRCYEISKFIAIGSGGGFAYTAYYLGKSIYESVKVATELDLYCGGDVKTLEIVIH